MEKTGAVTTKLSYNEENLANVRLRFSKKAENSSGYEAFTKGQKNSPCDVVITEESGERCADALLG